MLKTSTKVAVASGGAATAAAGTGAGIYLTNGSSNSGTRISTEEEQNNELVEEDNDDNQIEKPKKTITTTPKEPSPIKTPLLQEPLERTERQDPPVSQRIKNSLPPPVVETRPVSKNYTEVWANSAEFQNNKASEKDEPTFGYAFSSLLLDPDKSDDIWSKRRNSFLMNVVDSDSDTFKNTSSEFKLAKGANQPETKTNLKNKSKKQM